MIFVIVLCIFRHSLHIISDEMYMLSIFKEDVSMKSALAVKGWVFSILLDYPLTILIDIQDIEVNLHETLGNIIGTQTCL
jgi:hypothetical protein